MSERYDLILVGAGLSGGLAAYHLLRARPDLRVLVVEGADRLGGAHTWSFHGTDVSSSTFDWLLPFVRRSWRGHEVRFPGRQRTLEGSYHSISASRFHEVLVGSLKDSLRLSAPVAEIGPEGVRLESGEWLEARAVIDARGLVPAGASAAGYQKFVGIEIECEAPHGLTQPMLMDATCEQLDGFRFFYLLPWSKRELLIEDTRYSATPDVDVEAYRDEILSYAARRQWRVAAETYREVGVLPIPLSAHFTTEGNVAQKMRHRRVGAIGTRAGFFHATTGYSVPHAARVAEALASLDVLSPEIVSECLATAAEENEARGSFYRLLNRMLIRGASPDARYRVLERFYGLPEPLVARFYAMRLTAADGLRLLVGKPPIPIHRAIRCLWERGTHAYA